MSGKIVRPGEQEHSGRPQPKIVGTHEVSGGFQVLDKNTKQEAVQPEVRVHEEIITEADRPRSRQVNLGDPEVRVRSGQPEEFEKIKRGDDE